MDLDPNVLASGDPSALRAVYDAHLRAYSPAVLPAGTTVERDGPVWRVIDEDQRGFVTYQDLSGLSGSDIDALIARQRDFFAARGQAVEWKLHGHDQPADLAQRLLAAGFVPEEEETVVIGPAGPLAAAPVTEPPGVRVREAAGRADLDAIASMESRVWSEDQSSRAVELEREIAADPDAITVLLAEATADATVVCAGWVRYVAGTPFATLWGGSTLPAWRRRGIYRALVAHRARLAVARGYTHLQVDASANSRPILLRLGFLAVTTTTPYVFTPASG